MDILYDHQAFIWSKYAGIPRYFSELISRYQNDNDVNPIVPDFYTVSEDYRKMNVRGSHYLDGFRDLVIRDGFVHYSLKLWNRNPTGLFCFRNAQKASIALLKQGKYDVFHPTFHSTYFQQYISNKPYVMTIHDLSVEIFPEYVDLKTTLRRDTETLLKNVTWLIADSECTKQDLIEYYDVDSDKVSVVYLAPTFDKAWVDEVLKNDTFQDCRRPYLLFVNVRSGRKNFYTLVNAIRKILVERNLDLICVGGGPFTKSEKMFLLNTGIADRVLQCTVSNEELYLLYKHAKAFLYPSVNEGFGIPILEAYACGCPIVLSNASCLPEIGGDAAEYFNPKGIVSIQEAVLKVLDDEKCRNKMIEHGYRQLEKFSWNRCAEETKRVYEKAIE